MVYIPWHVAFVATDIFTPVWFGFNQVLVFGKVGAGDCAVSCSEAGDYYFSRACCVRVGSGRVECVE